MENFDQEYVEIALNVLGGKWKSAILWNIRDTPKRFNELLRLIPNITKRMLVQQLRELEHDKIIHREVYNIIPPKVEYSITEYGQEICPVFQALNDWGKQHKLYMEKHMPI